MNRKDLIVGQHYAIVHNLTKGWGIPQYASEFAQDERDDDQWNLGVCEDSIRTKRISRRKIRIAQYNVYRGAYIGKSGRNLLFEVLDKEGATDQRAVFGRLVLCEWDHFISAASGARSEIGAQRKNAEVERAEVRSLVEQLCQFDDGISGYGCENVSHFAFSKNALQKIVRILNAANALSEKRV